MIRYPGQDPYELQFGADGPLGPAPLSYDPGVGRAPDLQPPAPEAMPLGLDEEEERELVKRLTHHYDTFQNDIQAFHKKIDHWHKLYEAKPAKEKKDFPWPGAANYSIPLIASIVDAVHARIAKAVFDVDPVWLARPRSPAGVNTAKKVQWYLDYWADYMALPRHIDIMTLDMCIEGTGITKVEWGRKTTNTPAGEVVEYDAPTVYQVPLKDFILIPADAPTMDDAVFVGHRVFLNTGQLRDREKSGYYSNVQKLLDKTSGDTALDKRVVSPTNPVQTTSGDNQYEETRQYEIVELYGRHDFQDGFGARMAVFTLSPRHKVLLRADVYPVDYQRYPYVDYKILPRSNSFWGRSLSEILEPMQEELTVMHNQRSDAITKRIAPPIKRMQGTPWNPKQQPWSPGQVIDVTGMDDVSEMPLQDVPPSSFAHENDILAFVERLTGMSDYHMGRNPSQGRTATEVNRVVSEGLARLDIQISRFQYSLIKLAWHIFWLLYQYRPLMDAFHADGEEYIITKAEMRPDNTGMMPYEFVPHGLLSEVSKENLRQQNLLLLQVVAPHLSQHYPDGLQYLLDDTLSLFDKHDRTKMLGPSWNLLQQQMQQIFQQGMQAGMQQAVQAAQQQGQ